MTDDEHIAAPIEEILDHIPDALERTRQGLDQACRGEGVRLGVRAEQPPRSPG